MKSKDLVQKYNVLTAESKSKQHDYTSGFIILNI